MNSWSYGNACQFPTSNFQLPRRARRASSLPGNGARVIYLFMAGGPSQIETFDYKPVLNARNGEQLPDSVRQGQRLTGMSGNQSSLPLAGSQFGFRRHGEHGAWVSDLLPHTARIVDDLCIVRSMYTEAINHDPAITFLQTGSQIAGRPSMGAWVHYGLGSDNEDLPAFVVLITPGKVDQPLYARLWGSGFLPSEHQGVQFRSGTDAVLYLNNPAGVTPEGRRLLLDRLRDLHAHAAEKHGDSGGGRAHRAVRDVVPHAGERAGRDGRVGRDGGDVRAVRSRLAHAGHLRRQLPARAAARRARREVHPALSPGLGPARQPAARHRAAVPRDRSGERGARHRPEAARDARRHAGGVGRRVRPHELLAGQAHGDELRPRPSPALLQRVDGGRRREGPGYVHGAPTTSATTSWRAACTCTTSTPRCCTCSACTTSS
jgi:hypothetical protein